MLVHLAEAPINLKNFYGESSLHLAVEGGFTDIVEVKEILSFIRIWILKSETSSKTALLRIKLFSFIPQ
jgi:hypothetical protein